MNAALNPSLLNLNKVNIWYGETHAVKDVSFSIKEKNITAIIGPSGCGKSTLLRTLNRMNDFVTNIKIEGKIVYHGKNIYDKDVDPVKIRQHIGMVFQKPNPFPKSIFNNIAWGPKINGYTGNISELVEEVLKKSALWEEVKDRLHSSALSLSGGQQQRLCIARALAMQPDMILMDEPCSALDPVSTAHIEDLIFELKQKYTIVIVTHNMQQASRVSDYTAFLVQGNLIEYDQTSHIFTKPQQQKTADYVMGRFG